MPEPATRPETAEGKGDNREVREGTWQPELTPNSNKAARKNNKYREKLLCASQGVEEKSA